jgi:adenylate cyclase
MGSMETLGVTYPAHLVLSEPEKRVDLGEGTIWRLGRSEHNQVVIRNDLISRNHAMLQRTDAGEYYLIDLGSRNGSFVNGRRVSVPAALRDGDRISLGDYQLVFHQDARPVAAAGDAGVEEGATKPLYVSRLISVLVVDIRDFTGLSQRVDEAELCQLIGAWFNHASNIMQQHGSWTQKYIGDAVMSVWMHRDREREAEEIAGILHALGAFVKATEGLAAQVGVSAAIRIGAGINTGYAAMGNTGSGLVTDYTALGTTVNAAFRLESATKELKTDVALGEGTYERLKRYPAAAPVFLERTASLKGFEGLTRCYSASFDALMALLPALAKK